MDLLLECCTQWGSVILLFIVILCQFHEDAIELLSYVDGLQPVVSGSEILMNTHSNVPTIATSIVLKTGVPTNSHSLLNSQEIESSQQGGITQLILTESD